MAVGKFGEECAAGHTAMIYDRGGMSRVAQLVDLSSVKWNRARNVVTDATVILTGRACDGQREQINAIAPHRHELVIYRGTDRVWEGPIVQVSSLSTQATIIAKDVGHYLEGTALSRPWPNVDNGGQPLMTDRIEDIIAWELTEPYDAVIGTGIAAHNVTITRWEQQDPPVNILPYLEVRPGNVLTFSDTMPFEMSVAEHLANLARSGVDVTVVGRKILVWDMATAIGRTRQLTESDFTGDPEVISSGADHTVIFHVSAQQRDEETDTSTQVGVGNAGGVDSYYGPWTMIHTADSEESGAEDTQSQDALNSQAQRGLVGRNPVPIELRMPGSAGLRLSHDLTINMLVPGTEMPLLATLNLHRLSQMQILDKVSVDESAAGENISVTLVPSGAAQVAAWGLE